jgi:hypothetical protein
MMWKDSSPGHFITRKIYPIAVGWVGSGDGLDVVAQRKIS